MKKSSGFEGIDNMSLNDGDVGSLFNSSVELLRFFKFFISFKGGFIIFIYRKGLFFLFI